MKCLIVEDDSDAALLLREAISMLDLEPESVPTGRLAESYVREHLPEVILLDLGLPDVDGLELLEELVRIHPSARILVITGNDDVSTAVRAMRAGARDYLVKPWDLDDLLTKVSQEIPSLSGESSNGPFGGSGFFWGSTPALRAIQLQIEKLAASPLTPVLIMGETGTGKEVVARELHNVTDGAGPFVSVNCSAFTEHLFESELFGHEAGAFTGALREKPGLVELAEGGTLFLDEIAELPPTLQPKLLRFLEDFTFRRVGSTRERKAPSRVVAATNRNLVTMVETGAFRSDLYFRLSVVTLALPPLREWGDSLVALAHHLVRVLAWERGFQARPLTPAAERRLLAYHWPGNIRELKNRLEKALIFSGGGQLELSDLPVGDSAQCSPQSDERQRLLAILEAEKWNVSRAARRLGLPRHVLRYRLDRLGVRRPHGTHHPSN